MTLRYGGYLQVSSTLLKDGQKNPAGRSYSAPSLQAKWVCQVLIDQISGMA